MKNSHKFFNNHHCEYFPCHNFPSDRDEFNCLFCFCPLFPLGKECGGTFEYLANGIKSCQDCHLPHTPGFYDHVMSKFTVDNLIKIGGRNEKIQE